MEPQSTNLINSMAMGKLHEPGSTLAGMESIAVLDAHIKSKKIQHRSRVTSQIHASYTRVLPVPHATHLIITMPIEMAPKFLEHVESCYKCC